MSAFYRRDLLKLGAAGLTAGVLPASLSADGGNADGQRRNVLFIAVDDLRPQLSCYGHALMQTPHLDALAAGGVLFKRAFCNVPVCAASRCSLMTGLRPTKKRWGENRDSYKDAVVPDIPSLGATFKAAGYSTVRIGKIYHNHGGDRADDDRAPWDVLNRDALAKGEQRPWSGRYYLHPDNVAMIEAQRQRKEKDSSLALSWERAEVDDGLYIDGHIAARTCEQIRRLKNGPFFIAAGFKKPHLPFTAPAKYWDLYDRKSIDLADNPLKPKGAPASALHNWPELRRYKGIPAKGRLPDELARTLIHGYYACCSYVDAMIGQVLDCLEKEGLAQNTLVVLWGDHGWNLGEHGLWCKHALFETSLHAPLMVRDPSLPAGQVNERLVSFLDIYPTVCDLAGIAKPKHLDGDSLLPIIQDPNRKDWKDAVFARFKMGASVRTDRYRYSQFYSGKWRPSKGAMLYDLKNDPGENVNLVDDPAHAAAATELSKRLAAWLR